ncbi:MAG: LptE family protein [Paludibacteraceae bacterium]|nr:LptE family protein [Paludibacteraceae bacterium]
MICSRKSKVESRKHGWLRSRRWLLCLVLPAMVLVGLSGCSISYKFNGSNIDYSVIRTIAIEDFPNNAALVYAPLSNTLSEEIRDTYQRQTRLQITNSGGDLELSGEIIGYDLTPMGVASDNYSAETKLTMRIQVHFTNNIHPEESFDRTYSAYQTFDSSQTLNDVQEQLCQTMIKELVENIYNDTVAKW